MLGALVGSVPPRQRIITCEEVFELNLGHRDVVALQCRQPSLEGTGEIPLRRLVKEALRMRPDRLIIGEVREAEALDLLVALNAGVPGLAIDTTGPVSSLRGLCRRMPGRVPHQSLVAAERGQSRDDGPSTRKRRAQASTVGTWHRWRILRHQRCEPHRCNALMTVDSTDFALEGARQAVQRALTTSDPRRMAHAASEGAYWIAALDEGRSERRHDSPHRRWVEAAGVADLFDGLRYVRNQAAHELALLAYNGGGLTVPFTIPFRIEVVPKWSSEDLPQGERPKLLSAYQRELAGTEVAGSLIRAIDWLDAESARFGASSDESRDAVEVPGSAPHD